MKTYTFKVKLHYPSDKNPGAVLAVIHCPLEVFFNSLKEFKELEAVYKALKDPSNKEVPNMFITASDYLGSNGVYVSEDVLLCDYKAIIESNTLTELLTHLDFYGFVGDILLEKKPAKKSAKKPAKKVVKDNEV